MPRGPAAPAPPAPRSLRRRRTPRTAGLIALLVLVAAVTVWPRLGPEAPLDGPLWAGAAPVPTPGLRPAAFEGTDAATPRKAVRFGRDIRPLLSDKCYQCHGPDVSTREAGLRLDTRAGLQEDLGGYAAVVPGKPAQSRLMQRITEPDPADRMPPPDSHKHLTPDEIERFRDWIAQGAEWQDHWAYEPVRRPELPPVSAPAWVSNPIDAFVLSRLDAEGLTPNEPADPSTLIRRVSLDTRGLPPSPEEILAFTQDTEDGAYERMVDRMLASPQYGEHRAHYWLDAARYGDTHGYHFDNFRSIWPYRDWVVKAYNDNMPFDRFTVEQLAGDLLPDPTQAQRVATGFNRCNPTTNEGGTIPEEYEAIYALDRVEATTGTWLGLTAGCAACHDHKFDPVSQREFYELTAFFRNTTQPAMDGNALDTAPSIHVYADGDLARATELQDQVRDYLKDLSAAVKKAPEGDPDTGWVAEDALAFRLSVGGAGAGADGVPGIRLSAGGDAPVATLAQPIETVVGQPSLVITPDTLIDAGDHGRLSHQQAFTLSFWVRMPKDNLSEDLMLFGRYNPEGKKTGWWVEVLKNRQLRFNFAASVGGGNRVTATIRNGGAGTRAGEWNHVTLVHHPVEPGRVSNRDFAKAGLTAYVNGKVSPRFVAKGGAFLTDFSVDQPLVIGRRPPPETPDDAKDGAEEDEEDDAEDDTKDAGQGGDEKEAGKPKPAPRIAIEDLRIFDAGLTQPEQALLAKAIAPADRKPAKAVAEAGDAKDKHDAGDGKDQQDAEDGAEDAVTSEATPFDRAALAPRLRALRGLQAELQPMKAYAPVTLVMEEKKDSEPFAHILARGQYDQKGDRVTAGVPGRLPPLPEGAPANRLGLAQWIVAPENPLTARVTVNRFWMELFGTGLVKTAEDFGSQGETPTHPDLLDWLADAFVASGWDVKQVYRLLLTSSTYRQSSFVRPELLSTDPDNRLLARGPRFRLDAEVIRDQALWLSGLLIEDLGGPPVKPYQPAGIWKAVAYVGSNTGVFKADTGSKLYRRAIYTLWKRTATPPMMAVFDAPPRENCTVRRERTNTPLQALVLMNDPQFVEAARHLAQRVLRAADDDRVGLIYTLATGQPPTDASREAIERTHDEILAIYREAPDDAAKLLTVGDSPVDETLDPVELATWTMVANQVMNMDAFISKN